MSVHAIADAFRRSEPWMLQAACRNHDHHLWFPTRGETTRKGKTICTQCPVRLQCLNYAITTHQEFGTWGGLSPDQRRRYRKARTMPTRPP